MPVAKIIEITSSSPESFTHAIKEGVTRARQTIDNVRGAWVKDQSITFKNGEIDQFRVTLKVTFILEG